MSIAGKRYQIKSRSRFTVFVIFSIVLFIMVSNTILGFNNASSLTQKEYTEITVQSGDTLWNIAKTYMPENTDIRDSVYTLCQINNIAAHELKAGQTILVPIN